MRLSITTLAVAGIAMLSGAEAFTAPLGALPLSSKALHPSARLPSLRSRVGQPISTQSAVSGLQMVATKSRSGSKFIRGIHDPSKVFCACGSEKSYQDCCYKWHDLNKAPEDPEELIRARYSAYALRDAEYIIGTTLKSGPEYRDDQEQWKREIISYMDGHDFMNPSGDPLGVFILSVKNFGPNVAYVRFKARLLDEGGNLIEFIESSRCEKKGNRWYYAMGNLMEHNGMYNGGKGDDIYAADPIDVMLLSFSASMVALFL